MSSRNDRGRAGAKPTDSSDLDLDDPATQQAMQGLNFTVPTEFVDIPSRGLYYPADHVLHGIDSVEMRHMTAKEEDILASVSLVQKGIAVDRMLESLIVNERIKIDDLLVGDRNALTIAARVAGYGSEYLTSVVCPSCQTQSDFTFDLDSQVTVGAGLDRDELNQQVEDLEITDHGTFIIKVPKSESEVEIRLMTGADENSLENFHKRKEKQGQATSILTDTLKMIIVGVNGVTDRGLVGKFVDIMPAMDSKFLRGIYAALIPNVDLTQEFHCSKCGARQDLEVPVNSEFFWPRS